MASTFERRLELHDLLADICSNCYFEPPASVKLKYPCIVYNRDMSMVNHANNLPYTIDTRYTVTVIDSDPDSAIVPEMEKLPKCHLDRHFVTNGLNHDVFTMYY